MANRPKTGRRAGEQFQAPLAADTVIDGGKIVCGDTSGNLVPGATSATLVALGVATDQFDNTDGAAGDVMGDYESGCFGPFDNSAGGDEITLADKGKLCYLVDDETVALTSNSGARSIAGTIADVDDDGVYVEFGVKALANFATGVGGSMSAGTGGVSTTGDLAAAGGFRSQIQGFTATLAADGTNTAFARFGVAARSWLAQRAGSIMGLSGKLSAALTGAGQHASVRVAINGTPIAAAELDFTEAGGETELTDTFVKGTHAFVAGDEISLVVTTDTITNTPVVMADIEIEQ